ncbi:MAG: methyltransferase domain-containing protein [Gammaproteobacteria bacterium]
MKTSRENKLNHFYSIYKGGPIVDVGVSSSARIKGENVFLEEFALRPDLYTGLGVEDLSEVAAAHPDKRFVRYAGGKFPFKDNEFDWVFSNAVIEHVGDDDAHLMFINEMLRVAKTVFFTTPNKFFPVESHTNAIFLHWVPGEIFYRWCARYRPYWNETNLRLLSYSKLNSLMKKSNAQEYKIYKNSMLGWPLTFTVVCKSQN